MSVSLNSSFNQVIQLIVCFFLVLIIGVFGCMENLKTKQKRFRMMDSEYTGISFQNKLIERADHNILLNEYFFNGSGVSIGDINNDGLPDLYFVANQQSNRLYLNKGNFKFEDITEKARVQGHEGWATGSTMIDINNDGFLDLYVCYSSTHHLHNTINQLFINSGELRFSEKALQYNLHDRGQSTQSAFLDYDLDGDLDMFLLNHQTKNPKIDNLEQFLKIRSLEAGDRLYRNDDYVFTDVSKEAGILANPLGYGLGVAIGDVDQNGWPDIYVSNDFLERDYLYINNTDGAFIESSRSAFKHIPNFSMGNDIADFNNNGLLDIVSLDMVAEDNYGIKTNMSGMDPEKFWYTVNNGFHYQYMFNTLQMNMGKGKFSEVAKMAGVSNTDWSWAPLMADFDNDGFKDMFVSNGFRRNFRNNDSQAYQQQMYQSQKWDKETIPTLMKELLEKIPIKKISNYMFKNHEGEKFENLADEWGLDETSFSNGAAYADLDNDGDLDLIVNNIDQEAFIYRNNTTNFKDTNFLKIKFEGNRSNIDGIGTKVSIYYNGCQQYAEHYVTRGYESAVARGVHFGLGNTSRVDSLVAIWFDGRKQVIEKIESNQTLLVSYNQAKTEHGSNKIDTAIFYPLDLEINFTHTENQYDDYKEEVLLPHKYSQFGPGIATADVDGDGLEDFYVGGAVDSPGELFIQAADGSFQKIINSAPWYEHTASEDLGAAFFDADQDGDLDLYVVSGGNEFEEGNVLLKDRLYMNQGNRAFIDGTERLPDNRFSGSKVRPCDFDKDGDVDLFVGGRLVPHQYPKPASGFIYENSNGKFHDRTQEISADLQSLGLITDAKWVDIDNDEDMDLIVVGEWMGITVFNNRNGALEKSDPIKLGLDDTEGWWYSIESADFDKDGDMDLIAGNLGLNYKYKASKDEPFEVFASDFDNNGKLDIVFGFHEEGSIYPLRGRECSAQQMPFIKKKFANYEAFGKATIEDMVGKKKMERAINFKAKTFATTYFENTEDGKFIRKQLPWLTQMSSVNEIIIEDFNGDNNLDMVLAGNLYAAEVETPRNDASYGVFLAGDGKGNFQQYYPYESGLYLDGDVKELALVKGTDHTLLLCARNNEPIQFVKIKCLE